MNDFFENVVTNPVFLTYIGAMCGHILSLYSSDFKGAVPFLEHVFPNKSQAFYFRMDFLVVPVIGALLAFVLLDPTSLKTAIFAGLSWSGTLAALLKKQASTAT